MSLPYLHHAHPEDPAGLLAVDDVLAPCRSLGYDGQYTMDGRRHLTKSFVKNSMKQQAADRKVCKTGGEEILCHCLPMMRSIVFSRTVVIRGDDAPGLHCLPASMCWRGKGSGHLIPLLLLVVCSQSPPSAKAAVQSAFTF